MKATFYPPTIAIRPHLWLKWAKIAIRQEAWAREAREQGMASGQQLALTLGHEVEESIQAIAAVRHCPGNLAQVWIETINLQREARGEWLIRGEVQLAETPNLFTTHPPPDMARVAGQA